MEKGGWVYIMTNRPNGTLYTGVTADLIRSVYEHRENLIEGFTKTYGLHCLVYFEHHDDILSAISREKQIKEWKRAYKARLIMAANPDWSDLYPALL